MAKVIVAAGRTAQQRALAAVAAEEQEAKRRAARQAEREAERAVEIADTVMAEGADQAITVAAAARATRIAARERAAAKAADVAQKTAEAARTAEIAKAWTEAKTIRARVRWSLTYGVPSTILVVMVAVIVLGAEIYALLWLMNSFGSGSSGGGPDYVPGRWRD